jgi:DNA-binding NtrC family response regulator
MIVDDEPTICRALALALRRAGYDVLAAESGEGALAKLRTERVDCLVTDLRIPDLRGDVLFELAASLQPALRQRTLFMTGDLSPKAVECIAACNCPLLAKPFELVELLREVERILQGVKTGVVRTA